MEQQNLCNLMKGEERMRCIVVAKIHRILIMSSVNFIAPIEPNFGYSYISYLKGLEKI
jgi:hypothetical protein